MRNPFRYFNSSPKIIRLTVMMYIRYPLSLRQVEDILWCCQSNANQSPNIKIMRISRRQLTPFGHGRSAVLLECFAWG